MTKIDFRDEHIDIIGHAGDDSVCTGVSMLTYTLLYELEKYQNCGEIKGLDIKLTDGDVRIKFDKSNGKDVNIMLDVIYTGFSLLALEHPENVVFV